MNGFERNKLTKRYHTLLRERGVDNLTKESLLSAYGAESSTELTNEQLKELCDYIQANVNQTDETIEMDVWRKRVIRVVSKSLEAEGNTGKGIEYAKAVAARAAGYDRFNEIPKGKLVNLYHAFGDKCRTTEKVLNRKTTDYKQLN